MPRHEIERQTIVDLSKRFITIPSVTGNPEGMNRALSEADSLLQGFTHESFTSNGITSSLYYNTSERPSSFRVLLNGHLDVVSGRPEQFTPYENDGKLFGRGAIDMKSATATELLVFKSLAKNLPYPIALQLVTDEEVGGFNGTGYQVEQGVKADFVITGEATDLQLNNERKGVLVLKMTTDTNKPAHAAYLWNGDNALLQVNGFLNRLQRKFPVPKTETWKTSVNVASIETDNIEHNKVPSRASVLLDFRHIPNDKPEIILSTVKKILPRNSKIDVIAQGVSSYTDPLDPDMLLLAKAIEDITHDSAKFIQKHGSSDTRHLMAQGAMGVDFGPTGIGLHSDEEYVEIKSLEDYFAILSNFLLSIKS